MKRRDITLGEMQDECKRIKGLCVDGCKFIEVCPNRCDVETRPSKWDLSDPPRFNEAQMALLRVLRKNGVQSVWNSEKYGTQFYGDHGQSINISAALGLDTNKRIENLAELLGKDKQ